MIWHIYKYRIKCIVRDKQMIFWTFLFPIILAVLFNMAFSNLSKAENFKRINVAVVAGDDFNKSGLKDTFNNVDEYFQVNYVSRENADALLKEKKVEGYIYFDKEPRLVVQGSGLNESILKSFIDDYNESASTIANVIKNNPEAFQQGLMSSISNREDYITTVPISKASPETMVNYFYTLIAMTCLYGGFWGLKEVVAVQGDLSPQGARINMAPTHKMKVFLVSIMAAATIQLLEILTLLVFLILILKINFGTQIGYILITCFVGTITGVTFGTFVAAVVKAKEGIKISVLIGFSMIMSFLSGMMYDKMKYIVNTNYPLLGNINPANLITDSFYSLYYYNDHSQLYKDIILLCLITLFFSIGTYLVIRRQKYASL